MKQGKFLEAKENFEKAYNCLMKVRGIVNEDAVTILNNISVACVNVKLSYVYNGNGNDQCFLFRLDG